MKTALILAAGLGSRFNILTQTIPKGFLEILGKPIIQMSIENLLDKGYEKIVIVTGHQKFYYERFAEKYPEVETVFNNDYNYSGSGYSLYLGLQKIDGPCTVLESDLIYDKDILDIITHDANMLVSSPVTDVDDAVFIEETNGYMSSLSKNSHELKNHNQELVGITHLNTEGTKLLKNFNKGKFLKNAEYEQMYVKSNIHFALRKTDYPWCEIDNIQHYYRAVNKIFPKIHK